MLSFLILNPKKKENVLSVKPILVCLFTFKVHIEYVAFSPFFIELFYSEFARSWMTWRNNLISPPLLSLFVSLSLPLALRLLSVRRVMTNDITKVWMDGWWWCPEAIIRNQEMIARRPESQISLFILHTETQTHTLADTQTPHTQHTYRHTQTYAFLSNCDKVKKIG